MTVTLSNRPRYIDPVKCTGCGECARHCPVTAVNGYNMNLDDRRATYIEYAQAVPLAFAIDTDTCIGCGLCENMCIAKAIQYDDAERETTLNGRLGHSLGRQPGLRPLQPRLPRIRQVPQRGHQRGVRAYSERFRALFRPPDAAPGPGRAPENRLAPVRRVAGCQPHAATATAPRSAACTPSRRP